MRWTAEQRSRSRIASGPCDRLGNIMVERSRLGDLDGGSLKPARERLFEALIVHVRVLVLVEVVALAEERPESFSSLAQADIDVLRGASEHGRDCGRALILYVAQNHTESHPRRQAMEGDDDVDRLDIPRVRGVRSRSVQAVCQRLTKHTLTVPAC